MLSLGWILICLVPAVLAQRLQWQPQDSGTTGDFRGLCAVSAQTAWVGGTQGTVLRTLDGGAHWAKVSVPGAEKLDFRNIQAFDAQEASALSVGPGEQSRIYKTTDGGKQWRLLFTNPDAKAFYDGFAFWDRKHGIALSDPVDGHFRLLITEDGEHWKPLIPETMPAAIAEEGAFAASGTCIAVSGKRDVWFVTGGPAARLFHSADRGLHWEVIPTPILSGVPSQGIFSIAFQDARNGIIVGGDYKAPQSAEKTVAYTRDGGKTWKPAERLPAGFRSAVAFLPGADPKLWITVGTSGSDYSTDAGQTWQPFDDGDYNAVSFADAHTGWAVGPKGRIARFAMTPER